MSSIPRGATPVADALRRAAAHPHPTGPGLRASADDDRRSELLGRAADAVILVAPDGSVTAVNPVAGVGLGLGPGDPVDALVLPSTRAAMASDVVSRAVREGHWHGTLELPWAMGTARERVAVFGHRSPDDALLGLSVVAVAPQAEDGLPTLADIPSRGVSLTAALEFAAGAARALAAVHHHGLVHRAIVPGCFVTAGAAVRITGFDRARPLAPGVLPRREIVAGIEGALPYLSPELTGRVNRAVDRRSDLYSLGVVLYELFTGVLPLEAEDPLEWVHCHVARVPPAMRERQPALPATLDELVMRLLSKRPEDRYQSAAGLAADLDRCLADVEATGTVASFALGQDDVRDVFAIPEKLYGRAAERDALDAAFARVAAGRGSEVVLVAGAAGIGKSTLVRALREPVTQARGAFGAGAVDVQSRDVPYLAFTQALGELVQQALAEPPAQLEALRARLREAVGRHGALVCELVPRAELLLGTCPAVAELPLNEAQRRLHRVLGATLDAFAAERPVVLFVDDLQWADAASIRLLEHLARPRRADSDGVRLLVVAAYRDEELETGHPLALALPDLAAAAGPVQLRLAPLDAGALEDLLAETLGAAPHACSDLAELVRQKTDGVPYFVLQFLHALHRRGLLAVDAFGGGWRWDLQEIAAAEVTDNVVDMMTQRLRRLPEATQTAVQVAACLTERIGLATLATAAGMDPREAEEATWDALRARLLIEREGTYRFSHDRVREAALASIPDAERAARHLEIARRLLADEDGDPPEDLLFAVTGQLNAGRELIVDPGERYEAARLNLRAGTRAMHATAMRSASRYLRHGIAVLPDDAWEAEPRLTFDLHLASARCEHAGGDVDETERLVEILSSRATEPLDIAAAAHLRVETLLARSRAAEAAEAGVAALARLGVTLSADPTGDETQAALDHIWQVLGDRSIGWLLDLPPADDLRVIAATSIFGPVMTSAFLAARQELGVLLMIEGVRLSIEHGNTPVSPLLHALLGSMVGARFGMYEIGREYMHAAHARLEALQNDVLAAQTGIYVGLGSSWTDPYEACLPLLRSGREYGMRVGDLAHVAFCAFFVADFRLAAGEPLDDVLRECDTQLPFADEMKLPDHRDAILIVERAVRSLRGETSALGEYADPTFDDDAFQERWRTVRLPFFHAVDRFHRTMVRVVANQPAEALAAARTFDDLAWAVAYHPTLGLHEVWGALARSLAWDEAPAEQRDALRAQIADSLAQLDVWAHHAPANFEPHARLVRAELARIEGRHEDAVLAYEQAVASARAFGRLPFEALAWERAGRHNLARGVTSLAHACLREAREGWARWGAHAKVTALDEEFPSLWPAAGLGTGADTGLDMLAVARGSQAISGELDLEELPMTLLRIAVEAAGAQAGRLLLAEGDDPQVVAVAEVQAGEIRVRRPPAGTDIDLPRGVTDYVSRTGERVLLSDARTDPTFSADPVIAARGIRSLLCQPILRDNKLLGMLVLEHGLVDRAFTSSRLTAIEILAAQAAISVETARLYRDVHEEVRIRRLTETELRASEEQFRTLVESAPDGIVIADDRGRIVLVNSRIEQLFGHPRDSLAGQPVEELVPDIEWVAAARGADAGAALEVERTGRRRDGAPVPVEVTLSPLERPGGVWTIGIVRDITERRRLEHELEHAADHDPLTGLFNRPRFERELGQALERVERSGTAAVLLVLDLDHLRDINDSLGPQVGDELIRALARALRERLRPADVLARLGGDEYALILTRVDVDAALAVAEELLDLVRHHALLSEGARVRTTASIGIAPIAPASGNAQDLLAAADVALDQAKEAGRDRAVVYTPDSGRRAAERHTWAERIRRALEHEEFVLHAQPILDLHSGEVTHSELLIRMRDGDALVPPADFLPTAERTGLITAIDRWVIRQAARLAASITDGRRIELNLSAKSLADGGLPSYIEREVADAGADPEHLVFEITETAAIANLPSAAALAERLTALGCHFALDDFGVGFGSFYYLKRLPLHYIKIDGDFIQSLTRSPTDQHVTKAIVGVAQGLGLRTIAEFVEDAETLALLRTYGVDFAQGFHVGRPGPVAG